MTVRGATVMRWRVGMTVLWRASGMEITDLAPSGSRNRAATNLEPGRVHHPSIHLSSVAALHAYPLTVGVVDEPIHRSGVVALIEIDAHRPDDPAIGLADLDDVM